MRRGNLERVRSIDMQGHTQPTTFFFYGIFCSFIGLSPEAPFLFGLNLTDSLSAFTKNNFCCVNVARIRQICVFRSRSPEECSLLHWIREYTIPGLIG